MINVSVIVIISMIILIMIVFTIMFIMVIKIIDADKVMIIIMVARITMRLYIFPHTVMLTVDHCHHFLC